MQPLIYYIHLFQVSFRGAEENDCKVPCWSGRNGRQQDSIHTDDGSLDDGLVTTQWSVHIQATEVFANRLQFLDHLDTQLMLKKFGHNIRTRGK